MNTTQLVNRLLVDEPLYSDIQGVIADIWAVCEELLLDGQDLDNLTGDNYLGIYNADEMMYLYKHLPT